MHIKPGDELRNHAVRLLSARYGAVKAEVRTDGKRADGFFVHEHFGRREAVFIECKDYAGPLGRRAVEQIWAAYSGLVRKHAPALLLLITRNGITPDAESYIHDEQTQMRHETIWRLENKILGLSDYIETLENIFTQDGLSNYYIEAKATLVEYSPITHDISSEVERSSIFADIQEWVAGNSPKPIAILGGYGAGKSSLAKRIASYQAKLCLQDPSLRRPILIKLGVFTGHTRLEGLLGAMFTHDFPVPSFNTHRFLELNAEGRLLIILDGFDEMKHAMTFADFRSQLIEINKLVRGNSRVLLLGRPNAFLSVDERHYVLRGRARIADDRWYRIPDWPEFTEYRLRDFSAEDRAKFVMRYLSYVSSEDAGQEWIKQRVEEVNRLAEAEPLVFGKPVHAKILSDLASDPSIDLHEFGRRVSQWQLYDLFFRSLLRKEVEKDARRPIGEENRLEFLRRLAFWLWSEQAGQTAFSAFDIPPSLLDDLNDGDSSDEQSKKREYLLGAFLEEKGGSTYFFQHRSFAEFLVADHMVNNPPDHQQHPMYASLVKEGVEEFLLNHPNPKSITGWLRTLGSESESDAAFSMHLPIPLGYISTLLDLTPSRADWPLQFNKSTAWPEFISCFGSAVSLTDFDVAKAGSLIRDSKNIAVSIMAWSLLLTRVECAVAPNPAEELSDMVANVLSRLFKLGRTNLLRDLRVPDRWSPLGKILQASVVRAPNMQPNYRDTWALDVQLGPMRHALNNWLDRNSTGFATPLPLPEVAMQYQLPVIPITNVMQSNSRGAKSKSRELFLEFIERNSSFKDLQYMETDEDE
ncbi:NACHT domain-containing protein [Hoeflea sp. AS60]|uniref:NACHT domain-containing protein n=1 Tax=Hoeflea sp. AS60 TaxID=3135780 RepID=UPI00316F0A3D